ncbi:MAG: hypothetical protein KatS3mg122_2444 [Caldimonas sp.]|uniref:hypothetical protein n=1 Tax=Caldimonas TaxID=196013 RepID=UPI000376A564|nr:MULTISPECIES: hypothetical protein [Caldimonas]GIX25213.1 MAG: hypothetical protein KatS3mg122_2444 [Caldimonas sp.]
MRVQWIDAAAWLLIYGGLLAAVWGGFVAARAQTLGLGFMLVGAACTAAGVVLVIVRARMEGPSRENEP